MKYKFKQDEEIKQILTSLEEKIYKNTFSSEKIYNSIMNNTKSSMNREINMKNKEKNDDLMVKSTNKPIFQMKNMKNNHVHDYFPHVNKDNVEIKEYNLISKDITTSNYPYNNKNKEIENSLSFYNQNQNIFKDKLNREDDLELNIKKIFNLIDDLNKKVDSSKEREELLNQKLIELKKYIEKKENKFNENKTEKDDKDRSIIEIKEDMVKIRKEILSIQEKESSCNDEIEIMKKEMKSVKRMVEGEENKELNMEIDIKMKNINKETENKIMKIEEIINDKINKEINSLNNNMNNQRTELEDKIKLNEKNLNESINEIRKEIVEQNSDIKHKIKTNFSELKNIREENKENFENLNKFEKEIKRKTLQNEEMQAQIKILFFNIDLLKSEKRNSTSEDVQLKEEIKNEIITIKKEINHEKDVFQLRINNEILKFKDVIIEEERLHEKSVESKVDFISNNIHQICINLNESIKKYEDEIKKELDRIRLDIETGQINIFNDKNKEFSSEIDIINKKIRGFNDKIRDDEVRNMNINEEVKNIKMDVRNLNDQLNNLINTKSDDKYKIQMNHEMYIENKKGNIEKIIKDLNICKENGKKDLIFYTNQEVNDNDNKKIIISSKENQIHKENDKKENDKDIEIEVKGEKIMKPINVESCHDSDKKINYNNQFISETSHKKVDFHLENIKYHDQIDDYQLKSSFSVNESHDVISEDKEIIFHINQSCMNHNILKSDQTNQLQSNQGKASIFIDNHQFEEIISTIKNDIEINQINNTLSKKYIFNQEYIREYNNIYVKLSFPGYMRKYIIKLPFSIEYETENDYKQMDDYIESVGVSELVDDEMEIGEDIDVENDGIGCTNKIRNPFMISNIEKDGVFDESSVEEIIDGESI